MRRILAGVLSLVMLFSVTGVIAAEGDMCNIGDAGYPTLSAAVEAVTDATETTIVLASDAQGGGVVIPSGRNIILDLGGNTYDIVAPTVGSAGTETSGFQLLKDSTITIKNGTIKSEEAKFLIQNYSNLTLDGVTLDGSKLKETAVNYTLSNNCGDIVIKDSTIIADEDATDFAFDVCDYSTYSGVKVTVKGDSKIDGKIEITDPNGGEKKPELVVESGSFTDIATAIENAKNEATIKLLKDTSDNGIKVASGKNFTLDLGGNTYTVVAPTVGSEGTKTSGFQLLKDSTITIKNGTIKSEEAKFLIQNYSNLTLDGVTLDGSKLAEAAVNYTLSNNCGTITIKDSTIIADEDANDFAFDVCDYATYTGVTVTVTGDSAINGAFEVTNPNGGENNAKLIINGGKFTQDPTAYLAKGNVAKSITDSEPYLYQVTVLENENVNIAPPSSAVVVPDESAADEVKDVAAAVTAPSVAGNGAFDAIEDAANEVEVEEAEAKAALETALETTVETPVNLYVQPAVEIKIAEAEVEDGKYTSITLDIEVYTQVVVSTADNHEDIVLDGVEQNAVVLPESKKPMTVDKPVVVTIPVNDELESMLPETIMVKHIKDAETVYYYPASIDRDNNTITFTNPNGFSEFEISEADSQTLTIAFDGKDQSGNAIEDISEVNIYDIGQTLTLENAYKSGYRFDGWNIGEDKTEYKESLKITEAIWEELLSASVENVVTLKAKYTKKDTNIQSGITGSTGGGVIVAYTINFDTTGGTAVESAKVVKGSTLAEPTAPSKGDLVFEGWYTDRSFSEKYDFSAPVYSSFTLFAKWSGESATIFSDVTENDWFYDVVNEAYEKGLMNGMDDGTFAPALEVTRGMFATVLYRIAGEPEIEGSVAFTDVELGKYYEKAIAWAASEGIVNGMSETEFMPTRSISREQMATILYRYAKKQGKDASVGEDINALSFSDAESINDYATEAIGWALNAGLMNGYPDGTFGPQNTATRAETAAVFVRMLNI